MMDKLLTLLNSWWKDGKVPEDLAKSYLREPFQDVLKLIDYRQAVLLTGLRRVGKSTLMYQTINHLIREGVDPKHLLYFSFDERISDPLTILDSYSSLTGVDWRREHVHVFFDEVQKLSGWSSKLKLLYDSSPNLKFFLSGSGGVLLEEGAASDLAGRYLSVRVSSLSLKEFFEMSTGRRVGEDLRLWEDEIRRFLGPYLERPFPEIVKWEDRRRIEEYIGESILEKVVRKDIPQTFKGVNEEALMAMLEIFYREPGIYISLDSLAKSLRMSKKNLLKHLFYMEFSCLTKTIRNFRPSLLASSRKLKRVYPYHWALAEGLHLEAEKGKLLESVVATLLDARYYWREGAKEVDFLLRRGKDVVPLEVKAKEDVGSSEVKNLRYFMRKFGAKKGYVVYSGGEERSLRFREGTVKLVPLLKLCLFGPGIFLSTQGMLGKKKRNL